MDKHFLHAPFEKNLPVLMGLLGVWNMSFMGYKTRTILPYAEALLKFPAHIQQVWYTVCKYTSVCIHADHNAICFFFISVLFSRFWYKAEGVNRC